MRWREMKDSNLQHLLKTEVFAPTLIPHERTFAFYICE